MPTNSKPTLSSATILAATSTRRNGHILPLPNEANPSSPRAIKLLQGMLAKGVVEERRTTSAACAWRTDDDGRHFLLRITDLGRATASESAQPKTSSQTAAVAHVAVERSDQSRAPRGKLGQVLCAVQAADGASIDDLIALTGWQRHTVRASLTRLRQTGVPIQLAFSDGQKRYLASQTAEASIQ